MKAGKHRLRKAVFIFLGFIIIVPIIVILFASPIAKYLVEKYSVKYTGRQIKMDKAYVNPFTGYAHFSNLRIYEFQSDSIFFTAEGVSASISLIKLLSKTYEISNITLDNPKGVIILNARSDFNFNDIIKRFSPSDTDSASTPLHINLVGMKISNGVFYFRSILSKINYFIKDFEFKSSGKKWNEDTLEGAFSFSSGIAKGDIKADFTINFKTLKYRYSVVARKYDLGIIQQYLKDISSYGTFTANLDADLKASGNLKDVSDVDTKGRIAINDFHFGKNPQVDYLSFDKFIMTINEVNPKKYLYNMDSFALIRPYFKYEQYDYLDNLETMFGKMGANVVTVDADKKKFNLIIELGHYLINVSKNFFSSEYKINRVILNQGNFQFNDYSQSEEFSISADPIYISADSIRHNRGRVQVFLKTGIKPFGNASIYASINPRDSEDFDVVSNFTKIPVTVFNPYIISYTSFPLDRGTINFNGNWKVRAGIIQGENHLLIIDPHVANRIKNKADKWIPMNLAMYLASKSGNVIDYQIPVSGNLKNPKVYIGNIILTAVKNIFLKPASAPYRTKVDGVENVIDKSITLKWEMNQSKMPKNQEKFVKKMAEYLAKNPTAAIVITPEHFEVKEKEYILFFEAKKKYYLSINKGIFTKGDSEYVSKMSVKDSLFVQYLDKHLAHSLIFTIQGKCSNLIGLAAVNNRFNELNKEREASFLYSFIDKSVQNKVTFSTSINDVPFNGFSVYKVTFKGELPTYLVSAYKELEELNDQSPRKEYKKEREN